MIESQRHSYHLVDPSPWPISGSLGALATTVGGTLFLILCGIRKYLGHLTKEHHVAFEAAAWYWHFVDVVRLFLFVSIYWWGGIEEIMADHVHQEMTRNWILVYLRLFLFISIKDLFLALISFPNKSKNLMDSSLPAMKDIHFSDSSTRSDYEMGKLSRVTLDFSSFYPTICLAYLKFFLVFFFSCPKIQDRLSCANEEGKAVFSWINSIYKGVKKSITFSLSFGPSCLQQGLQGLLPFHLSPLSSR
ncbi:succinate dehydrogenase subunit 4 [Cucumis melo var. makuwa]|uniref:Cytochrome c oxidase subunit 3 n=1 Tax=Cucumis melo var. makuwa TaxID=1194695 RepID=A0A5A7U3M2_CUCMM|nr:succinate dehydrogenase subunit 4 [Cucumis melo var. makuwa]